MNNFKEWLALLKENGLLCDVYCDKVDNAKSKLELVRCCLDANGANFLQEMQAAGFPLPYEVICSVFHSYINGRYIAEFKNERGSFYNSSIYCCFDDSDIEINTTLTTLLGCSTEIYIKDNDFCKIYVDRNCEIIVNCPLSSRCIIEYWGDAKIQVKGNVEKVELIAKK